MDEFQAVSWKNKKTLLPALGKKKLGLYAKMYIISMLIYKKICWAYIFFIQVQEKKITLASLLYFLTS